MASTNRPGIPPRRSSQRSAANARPTPLERRARRRADRPASLSTRSQTAAPIGAALTAPRWSTTVRAASAQENQRRSAAFGNPQRPPQQIGPRLAAVRPTVKALPDRPLLPSWLRSLLKFQKTSLGLAVVLAIATVGVYGWSVYSQQLWGKEYSRLQQLRRQERQLTANSEMLKHDIAKHVNAKELGLVPQSAEQTIFLKSAPERKPAPTRETAPPAPPAAPLGY